MGAHPHSRCPPNVGNGPLVTNPDLTTRLRAFLAGLDTDVREPADDASLIKSGLLDSLGLFSLAMWVEDEVGRRIDVAAIDLSEEWDSILRIVAYIERSRASNHAGPTTEEGSGKPEFPATTEREDADPGV